MEFIILKAVGVILYTAFVWYVGRKWEQFNSSSDIVDRYNEVKTAIQYEINQVEDRLTKLKAVV